MIAKELALQLAQRAETVASYLLPNGKKQGNEWRVGSISGEVGNSLGVHLEGQKAGIWCDFATGDKGDLLDLWAKNRDLTLAEAMKEASRWLGITRPQFAAHKPRIYAKPTLAPNATLSTNSRVLSYLTQERKLTTETINAFKISEQSGKIVFPYWRENKLIFVKYLSIDRKDGKKQITVEKDCEPCLFGWHLIPPDSRRIILCEGEIDAMTLHQYGLPALSVPFGGGVGAKHKWLEYEFDRLAVFDDIYLCFDNDSEGHAATHELIERLGHHRCLVITLPQKDANACLLAGVTQEKIHEYFQQAKTLDPEELKRAATYVDEVIDEFYPPEGTLLGYDTPWQKTQGRILFRPEELSVWTGINGHGKSQFLGHLVLHWIKRGAKVCIASLELKPKRLLTRLTKQAGGLAEPSHNYIRAIHDWYGDNLWLFDLVGNAKAERLLTVFLYARQRYGVNVFIIDSFMKLDISEDDYKRQKFMIEQLCDFKNQHNCHIHLVVHPRKAADESQLPGKLDNKGTGAISDLADNCFGVWRNKKKEDFKRLQDQGIILTPAQSAELEKTDCIWSCDKQRNGDWEGKIGLWFDPKSLQYLENPNYRPAHFVEYSEANNSGHQHEQSYF